ncbi:MAG: GGDEF domain-containing protein [Holosporales bacterium]
MRAKPAKDLSQQQQLHNLGVSSFKWDLASDSVDWRGPLVDALSPNIPFLTGSIYNARLDVDNFAVRCKALYRAHEQKSPYKVRYCVLGNDYESYAVEETGEMQHHSDGTVRAIEGSVTFLAEGELPEASRPITSSGYDALTGFPCAALMNETLATLIEQTHASKVPGAYLSLSFDRLLKVLFHVSPSGLEIYIKALADRVRQSIRFDDIIARTSCCTFGIILKDCDRWGVIRASERLLHAISVKTIEIDREVIEPSISIGGIVFPHDETPALEVMRRAEACLFKEQSTKGTGGAWTPYALGIAPELDRSAKGPVPGKRRARDKN